MARDENSRGDAAGNPGPVVRRGFARHVEGWEAGLVAVLVAGLGAALAVPWSVEPRDMPLPRVDERVLESALRLDRSRAEQIGKALQRDDSGAAGLYDVRALGAGIRAFGRAEVDGDQAAAVTARQKFGALVPAARAAGDEQVLMLRAFEQKLFLLAVEHYERTAIETADLAELGGRFVVAARTNGWLDAAGRVTMSETLRAVMFKKRWGELTGLTAPPFALSLDEQKAFYRFALDHPPRLGEATGTPLVACQTIDKWRLRKVDELAAIDATYPRSLAHGVLLARLGDYPAAAQAFRDHLAGPTGSELATLARNYLRFATEHAEVTP